MVLTHGQPPEDGIEYYGDGIQHGHCGVRIAKVKEYHDGLFKCSLTPIDSRQEETASLKIIVASESSYLSPLSRDVPPREKARVRSSLRENCE